jgi:hypothetical protein
VPKTTPGEPCLAEGVVGYTRCNSGGCCHMDQQCMSDNVCSPFYPSIGDRCQTADGGSLRCPITGYCAASDGRCHEFSSLDQDCSQDACFPTMDCGTGLVGGSCQ